MKEGRLVKVCGDTLLMTGQLQNFITKKWHPYTMKILKQTELTATLALYDHVVKNMENTDMLWRYPDETVAAFFGRDGIVMGVFVGDKLVAFRVLYFHHEGDLSNPLLCREECCGETAHLALCVVHPEFRGNSLQKKMGVHLLQAAQADRTFPAMCSIVSPHNYPSISDKFSLNMVVVKLMPKFKGLWRYIFYRNMDAVFSLDTENRLFVASGDYGQQVKLLEQGYVGVQLGREEGISGMFFAPIKPE